MLGFGVLLLLLVRLASIPGLVIFSVVEVDGVSDVAATATVVTGVVASTDNSVDAGVVVGSDNPGVGTTCSGAGTAGVGAGAGPDIGLNSDLLPTARAW